MSEQAFYYLQIASTLSVVFPLAMAVARFRQLDQPIRSFACFLAIGLAVDLAGWYFFVTKNGAGNLYVRHFYDLFEAIFFIWLISQLSDNSILKKSFRWLLPALLLFWATRFLYYDTMSLFKSSTQVLTAFTTSFCILQLVEKTQNVSRILIFWILLGMFFYCFTTYFIMGLLATKLSKAWYIHGFVNITTNMIYFIGFVRTTSNEKYPVL